MIKQDGDYMDVYYYSLSFAVFQKYYLTKECFFNF